MTNYAIRISRSASVLSKVFEKMKTTGEMFVAYEHPEEGNVHCHMLLMGCSVSTDTLKNYIKKEIGNVERTEWSFKSGADKDFISYMSKGKYDTVYVSGITADEVAVYKAKGYDKKAIRLEGGHLVKPIKEGLKKTKRELIELMLTKVEVANVSTLELLKVIRSVLMQNNEVLGNYKVMDYLDALMMYGDKHRWLDNMVSLYDKRYNR
nr:MAG: hypothetical protein [Chemarfal virus 221]